jgi:hypothetical protein
LVRSDSQVANVFVELNIEERDIYKCLQDILREAPKVAIPIDFVPDDLEAWTKTLKTTVKVWEIKKFSSPDGQTVLYSLPDEMTPTITSSISGGRTTTSLAPPGSEPFLDILHSGLLQVGQKLVLEYGPRGKQRQTFFGVVRENGLEVDDGQIMALSPAAVHYIRKAGSLSETANGWTMWKTEEGKYLDELRNQVYQEKSEG